MEIKGTAVKTIPEFIQIKYKERYEEWLGSLPQKSREILSRPVFATNWYPLKEAVIYPTEKMGDLFFKNREEAAWVLGRYSSEVALKGVYKIFLRISSPSFILSRIDNVFTTYYRPISVKVLEKSDTMAVMQVFSFSKDEYLAHHRIAGWIEKTIELTNNKLKSVELKPVETALEYSCIITATWE